MAHKPYYITQGDPSYRENVGPTRIPMISQDLDSVRTYQFEVHFKFPEGVTGNKQDELTLAAKQITSVGMTVQDIEVHRVNDKVFYPGKVNQEEVTVTFDNLYRPDISNQLWNWFKAIYNPMTGKYNEAKKPFKAKSCTILHLDAQGQPITETNLYGVYPKSWKTGEFNYSTNEFHTIELVLRYDFMESKAHA
jgi:hypothetical protein|tara:strand:+ start:5660 stop:6238 length:579 start_codon:yes stop_codon:yes gene_type:complete